MLSYTKADFAELLGEGSSVSSITDIAITGIAVKRFEYTAEGMYSLHYYYINGDYVYEVLLNCFADKAENRKQLFGAIEDSYQIVELATSYVSPEPTIDPELAGGRWVADNGNRIELYDSGIGTTNLSLWDYTPGSTIWTMGSNREIEWQAENGLLVLAYRTVTQVEYRLSNGVLSFTGATVSYSRGDGNTTSDLTGRWMPTTGGGGGIIFNSDGTGYDNSSLLYDSGDFTWYIENNTLVREYVFAYQWDYTVTGNYLTLFGTESSTTYTRVGG
jgi:hypothetical protein